MNRSVQERCEDRRESDGSTEHSKAKIDGKNQIQELSVLLLTHDERLGNAHNVFCSLRHKDGEEKLVNFEHECKRESVQQQILESQRDGQELHAEIHQDKRYAETVKYNTQKEEYRAPKCDRNKAHRFTIIGDLC